MKVNNEWVCQSLEFCLTSLLVSLKNFIRVWNNMSEYIRFLDTVTVLLKLFSPLCFHVWPLDGNVGLSHINHASPVSIPRGVRNTFTIYILFHKSHTLLVVMVCTKYAHVLACCHNHHGAETRISQFPITSNWDENKVKGNNGYFGALSRLLNTFAKISIFMLYEFKAFDLSYWTVLIDNCF